MNNNLSENSEAQNPFPEYTTDEMVNGFVQVDNAVITSVLKEASPLVSEWLRKNFGKDDEAADICQEAVYIMIKRLRTNGFNNNFCFVPYYVKVCKNLYYLQFSNQRKKCEAEKQFYHDNQDDQPPWLDDRKRHIFFRCLNSLHAKCKKLFKLKFSNADSLEIQNQLDLKHPRAVVDKMKNCKKSLAKKILDDPEFNKLRDEGYIKNK